jgi:hypothetical protein
MVYVLRLSGHQTLHYIQQVLKPLREPNQFIRVLPSIHDVEIVVDIFEMNFSNYLEQDGVEDDVMILP